MYSVLPAHMFAHQKRAADLITDGSEPPYGCWELNSGLLEEQSVILNSEPTCKPEHSNSYKEKHLVGAGL